VAGGAAHGAGNEDLSAEVLQTAAATFGMLAATVRLHIVWLLAHGERPRRDGRLLDALRLMLAAVPLVLLDCCARARIGGRDVALDAGQRHRLRRLADRLHADGTRVLAVAVRTRPARGRRLRPADEAGLTLLGYVGLLDEAKPSAAGTLPRWAGTVSRSRCSPATIR